MGSMKSSSWLITPLVLLFAGFYVVPFIYIITISVEGDVNPFSNYLRALSDFTSLYILWKTMLYGAEVTTACILFGYPLAFMISTARTKWRRLLLVLVLMPLWTSILVRSFVWVAILGREGLINRLVVSVGLTSEPIALLYNHIGAVVGMVHVMLPYMVLALYAQMSRMDIRLAQAASSLGASPRTAFLLVFVPLSMPGVIAGSLLVFVVTISAFVTPAVLGGPRDLTYVMLIENQVNTFANWNYAAAMSVIMIIVTAMILGFRHYMSARLGEVRTTRNANMLSYLFARKIESIASLLRWISLSKTKAVTTGYESHSWNVPGLSVFGLIVLVLSVAPFAALVPLSFSDAAFIHFPPDEYSLRWYENLFSRRDWTDPILRSALVALIVMLLATMIGLCASISLTRSNGRFMKIAYAGVLSPLLVPTLVYAVALYMTMAKLKLIGSYTGIILAHLILALPFVIVILANALRALDSIYEDAARTLGAHPIRAFLKVTLPLLFPAILTACIFSFLASFDEVVVALFITDSSTKTLPVRMWEGIRFEIDPTSIAVSVLLICLTIAGVLVIELGRLISSRGRYSDRTGITAGLR